ncbi:MAG: hypothetical protein ACYCX3_14265, partial [Thermoleophilia bacterium]
AWGSVRFRNSHSPRKEGTCQLSATWISRLGPVDPGYVFVAVGLSVVWLGTWAAYVFAGRPTPVETEAFHLVAALDMTLMVPALVTGGVLLWRRRPWGYVIAPVAGIQASLYLLVLSVNSAVSISRGIVAAPGELPIWGTLMVLTSTATIWLVRTCDAAHNGPNLTARR